MCLTDDDDDDEDDEDEDEDEDEDDDDDDEDKNHFDNDGLVSDQPKAKVRRSRRHRKRLAKGDDDEDNDDDDDDDDDDDLDDDADLDEDSGAEPLKWRRRPVRKGMFIETDEARKEVTRQKLELLDLFRACDYVCKDSQVTTENTLSVESHLHHQSAELELQVVAHEMSKIIGRIRGKKIKNH